MKWRKIAFIKRVSTSYLPKKKVAENEAVFSAFGPIHFFSEWEENIETKKD